ncbi:MAG: alpha/beta hydrolase [bacterium]|nr:alpha/beta hydrolase [bacterium]
MPLDPVLQTILERYPTQNGPDMRPLGERRREAEERRSALLPQVRKEPAEVARIEERKLWGEYGEFGVRIYSPVASAAAPLPALVFIHGGSWWAGSLDSAEPECLELAANAQCVVASVDYHLAPEFPFPAPLDDCYTATSWLAEQADALGVDPRRIAIAGSSAGGNLAAGLALLARDRGGPAICFQLLEIPATDPRLETESMDAFAEGYLLTRAALQEGWGFYLQDEKDRSNPYAAPVHAPDLSGLPPALIVTCEFDPLRDEAETYGARMIAAGVPVEISRYPGMIHGSQNFSRILAQARDCRRQKDRALQRAFASSTR